MEPHSEIFENLPQIEPHQRVEIYPELKKKIVDVLRGRNFVLDIFNVSSESQSGMLEREVETTHGKYRFIRNLGTDHVEIDVQLSSVGLESPNMALEGIRFKVGRGIKKDYAPDIEYYRILKKGGSRTLTNNVLGLRKVEKFIYIMQSSLGGKA